MRFTRPNPSMTKRLIFSAVVAMLSISAQTPPPVNPGAAEQMVSAGVTYNPGQKLAGTAIYAYKLTDGTFMFAVADFVPQTVKPFIVTKNIGTGIAYKFATFNGVDLYIPTAAGVSWSGDNAGWQWTTGILASVPVKSFLVQPVVRLLKSSVNNNSGLSNSGYQVMFGIQLGKKF